MNVRSGLGVLALVIGCSDGGQPAVDGPPGADGSGACPAGTLCLRHTVFSPGPQLPDGRLALVFVQLHDILTPSPPPFVGYDAPLPGTATEAQIPLASITLPAAIDDYRLCTRTCYELANPACDCVASDPKAAVAYIVAVADANGSGSADPVELSDYTYRIGAGYVVVAAADAAYTVPNPADALFTEGILDGIAPYRIIDPPTSDLDVLGVAPAGTVFDLEVCYPGNRADCDDARFPTLF
jgi:hypothetical protein